MFYLAARTPSVDAGRELADKLIRDHSALRKFREIVTGQGGDPRSIDDPRRLPQAQHHVQVSSPASGFVESIQCEQVGIASLMLGGGREKKEDLIDPAVGLVLHKKVGDPVREGEALCTVHYNSDARLSSAQSLLQQAYRVAAKGPGGETAIDPPRHFRKESAGVTSRGRIDGRDFISTIRGLGTTNVPQCTNGRHEWAV